LVNDAYILQALRDGLRPMGFKEVPLQGARYAPCRLLLKRQTLMANRAIAYIQPESVPDDFAAFLKGWRNRLAWKVGFFPFFYSLGMQMIVSCPGIHRAGISPVKHVAKYDNQFSIIQSVFLIDPGDHRVFQGRTWGQVYTGKYQDKIHAILARALVKG
jgi:hypothetical protein